MSTFQGCIQTFSEAPILKDFTGMEPATPFFWGVLPPPPHNSDQQGAHSAYSKRGGGVAKTLFSQPCFYQAKISRVLAQQSMPRKKTSLSLFSLVFHRPLHFIKFQSSKSLLGLPLPFFVPPESVSLGCDHSFQFLLEEINSKAAERFWFFYQGC